MQHPPNRDMNDPYQRPYQGSNPPDQGYNQGYNSPDQSSYPPNQGYYQDPNQRQADAANAMNRADPRSYSQEGIRPEPASTAAPTDSPFTPQEWQKLVSTPLQVSTAMVVVSPSGPIGMIQEAMAIGKSIQTLQSQGAMSPLLAGLGKHISSALEGMRSGGPNPFGDMQEAARHPDMARTMAVDACRQSAAIVQKASPQDASAYKRFVYTFAHNVAEAGKEGAFLGIFGGVQISEAEESLLMDISTALGMPRS